MSSSKSELGLDWLFSTQFMGVKLGLETTKRLLETLVGIDLERPPFQIIHVAGTNGKGSTCAFAEQILRSSGVRTGLFTSPHLIHFRERMRVNGEAIALELLNEELLWLKDQVALWDPHPSFFELTLALAMRHFVREKVDVVVLETGMGGRLDATNALPKDVAALTVIGMDHAQFLGDSLTTIAGEKAGIICCGCNVVVAEQQRSVVEVFSQRAQQKEVSSFEVVEPLPVEVKLGLIGKHQYANAAVAKAAVEALARVEESCVSIEEGVLYQALASTKWLGRFDVREQGKFVFDGAHNQLAALALKEAWQQQFADEKALLICGLVNKEVEKILACWKELAAEVWFVPVASPRSSDPEQLAKVWQSLAQENLEQEKAEREGEEGKLGEERDVGIARGSDDKVQVFAKESLQEVLQQARQQQRRVLVAGSLFLIGEALAVLQETSLPRTTEQ